MCSSMKSVLPVCHSFFGNNSFRWREITVYTTVKGKQEGMVGICDQRWPWAGHQEGEENAQQILWLGYGCWDKTCSSEVSGKSVECLMHWIFSKHENLIRWSSELCLFISVWSSSGKFCLPTRWNPNAGPSKKVSPGDSQQPLIEFVYPNWTQQLSSFPCLVLTSSPLPFSYRLLCCFSCLV